MHRSHSYGKFIHTPTAQQKIEELKLLLGKFSSSQNTHTILELAKFNLRQGRAISEGRIRANVKRGPQAA